MVDFGSLFTSAFLGAFGVKVLDILYQQFVRRSERRQTAKAFVDSHLDPVLKAADELVGKTWSLAATDFKTIENFDLDNGKLDNSDFASLLFLFGQFWAHIEIIRREGLSIAMHHDSRGKQLQAFFACLESDNIRLVNRITMRAIAETMVETSDSKLAALSFIKFVEFYEKDAEGDGFNRWLSPLTVRLAKARNKSNRQQILIYATIVQAMIDTLDPDRAVTKDRMPGTQRLSRQSSNDLYRRAFKVYLGFIKNPGRYTAMPKRRIKASKG